MIAGMPKQLSSDTIFNPLKSLNGGKYQQEMWNRVGGVYGAYKNAFNALPDEENAALQMQGQNAMQDRARAMGSLNSRGLGRSLMGNMAGAGGSPVAGMGAGAMSNVAQNSLNQQNAIKSGYQQQAWGLNNQMMQDMFGNLDAYRNLTMEEKKLKAQQDAQGFNPLQIAQLGIGVLGVL
jgi:coproporphyrinogen III oxidase-like Fe-S oxidoreductase